MQQYKTITNLFGIFIFAISAMAQATDEVQETLFERDSLFIASATEKVADNFGFSPSLSWIGEVWSNVSGGSKTSEVCDSLFTLGIEQDLSKLGKEDSNFGSLAMTAFWYTQSKRLEDWQGSHVCCVGHGASNIFSSDMVRVFEIYYTNEFEIENSTVGFRIGQLASDEDFMGMDYADLFLNSNLGAIPANACVCLKNGSVAFSQYSLATFGATIYFSNDNFDAIVGIYNGDAGKDSVDNHGFNYNLHDIAVWYQLGVNYEVFGLDGRIQLGGNYHSGDFENKYNGATVSDFYSFYLGIEQDFVADNDGNAILGGFVRIAYAPKEEISECDKYIDCGLNWFGPIPNRDDDIFGIAFAAMKINRIDYKFDNLLEITYRAQLTPAIAIQPTFQAYLNAKDENGKTNSAYVVGVRAEVNF